MHIVSVPAWMQKLCQMLFEKYAVPQKCHSQQQNGGCLISCSCCRSSSEVLSKTLCSTILCQCQHQGSNCSLCCHCCRYLLRVTVARSYGTSVVKDFPFWIRNTEDVPAPPPGPQPPIKVLIYVSDASITVIFGDVMALCIRTLSTRKLGINHCTLPAMILM